MSIDHFYSPAQFKNPLILGIIAMSLVALTTLFLSVECMIDLIVAAGFSKELALLNVPNSSTAPSQTFALVGVAALLAAAGKIISLILGVIFYLCWVYRTASNVQNLTSCATTMTPGGAVGWHFVPFMNLFRIPTAINEIWAGSQRLTGVTSTLVSVWFSSWILGNIICRVSSNMTDSQVAQTVMIGSLVDALGRAISIVAGIALILVIRQINNFQFALAQTPAPAASR